MFIIMLIERGGGGMCVWWVCLEGVYYGFLGYLYIGSYESIRKRGGWLGFFCLV